VTVVDNFDDNSISASWDNWGGGQVTESSQRLNLATTTGAGYYGIQRVSTLDINESYVGVHIISAGNQSLTSYGAYPIAIQLSTNNDAYWVISNGNIMCWTTVAGSGTQRATATWNATTYAWVRVGEVGGNIRWEYSSDGTTWNTATTLANPFSGDTVGIPYIMVGTDSGEASTTTLQVDDYSTWAAVTEVTGTAVANLGALTGTAAGIPTTLGTAAATLGALTAAAAGGPTESGVAVAALGTLTATAAGGPTTSGTAAAALGALTAAASGTDAPPPSVPQFPAAPLPMTVWFAPGADPVSP
jgi:hypothetical protein